MSRNEKEEAVILFQFSVCWSTLSITYLWSLEGTFFQHIIGIPMGTKCTPLPTDLFLYSYEAEFMHKPIKGFTDTKYFNRVVDMASQLNDITDLSKLDSLDVDEILQQLKQRFYKGNIYVSISKTNVFINHVL
jgi:hypothetical protein